MEEEMETYKSTKEEMKQVKVTLANKLKRDKETIDYLNGKNQRQLEYLQLESRTPIIKVSKKMILKQIFFIVIQNNTNHLVNDISSFKIMTSGLIK